MTEKNSDRAPFFDRDLRESLAQYWHLSISDLIMYERLRARMETPANLRSRELSTFARYCVSAKPQHCFPDANLDLSGIVSNIGPADECDALLRQRRHAKAFEPCCESIGSVRRILAVPLSCLVRYFRLISLRRRERGMNPPVQPHKTCVLSVVVSAWVNTAITIIVG